MEALPAFCLIAQAVFTVWFGARQSLKYAVTARFSNDAVAESSRTSTPVEYLSLKHILLIPLISSIVILVVYILFRFEYQVELIALGLALLLFAVGFFPIIFLAIQITAFRTLVLCMVLGIVAEFALPQWVTQNFVAFAISSQAIGALRLKSFAVIALLLCALLAYDIFWVFGTEVMEVVSKNVIVVKFLPLVLQYPRNLWDPKSGVAALGLGDVVFPGIFIAHVFRFTQRDVMDQLRMCDVSVFSSSYTVVTFAAYAMALAGAFAAVLFFGRAQPALLYVVPWLLLSVLITAALKGELKELIHFTDDISSAIPNMSHPAAPTATVNKGMPKLPPSASRSPAPSRRRGRSSSVGSNRRPKAKCSR